MPHAEAVFRFNDLLDKTENREPSIGGVQHVLSRACGFNTSAADAHLDQRRRCLTSVVLRRKLPNRNKY
eukprot:1168014-Amphidinium_carterae.1